MRKIIIVIILIYSIEANAQIKMVFSKLTVWNVNPSPDAGKGYGPSITGNLKFENISDSSVTIKPGCVLILFKFHKQQFEQSIGLVPGISILLLPKQTKEFCFFETPILHHVKLWNENKSDYRYVRLFDENKSDYKDEMLEILATLKIVYVDNNLKLETHEIVDVEINNGNGE
jgi:hypothetical protein